MHQSLLSFNSGELSPYLRHRSDFAKHASGAQRMENFLPLPYGAIQKRPGTRALGAALRQVLMLERPTAPVDAVLAGSVGAAENHNLIEYSLAAGASAADVTHTAAVQKTCTVTVADGVVAVACGTQARINVGGATTPGVAGVLEYTGPQYEGSSIHEWTDNGVGYLANYQVRAFTIVAYNGTTSTLIRYAADGSGVYSASRTGPPDGEWSAPILGDGVPVVSWLGATARAAVAAVNASEDALELVAVAEDDPHAELLLSGCIDVPLRLYVAEDLIGGKRHWSGGFDSAVSYDSETGEWVVEGDFPDGAYAATVASDADSPVGLTGWTVGDDGPQPVVAAGGGDLRGTADTGEGAALSFQRGTVALEGQWCRVGTDPGPWDLYLCTDDTPGVVWSAQETGQTEAQIVALVPGFVLALYDRQEALLPFVAAGGEKYLLHFLPGWLGVYRAAGTRAAVLRWLTDYAWPADQSPAQAQVVQLNDVAWITHPACAPMQLSRLSDSSWTLDWLEFPAAPCLDENLNRNRKYAVVGNPLPDAWALGATYTAEQSCLTSSEWVARVNHTALASNEPGVGDQWRAVWKRRMFAAGDAVTLIGEARQEIEWSLNNLIYNVGAVRFENPGGITTYGICVREHLADVFVPVDYPTTSAWALINEWSDYDPYGSTYYFVGYYTYYNAGEDPEPLLPDGTYRCVIPHVSSDTWNPDSWQRVADNPGMADAWALSGTYPVGTRRSTNGVLYECTQAHVPDEAYNKPGVGEIWQAYWDRVDVFGGDGEVGLRGPGQYYRISPERAADDSQVELKALAGNHNAVSDEIVLEGGWDLFTFGTWHGTFQLERSTDNGVTWVVGRSWQASGDRNVADAGTEDAPTVMRLRFLAQADTETEGDQRAVLIPRLAQITGYALLNEYVSATEMRGVAVSPVLSGSTWRWAEGAFSDTLGYPKAIALHERRLWFASTAANPVSLWGSASDDMTNFETGTADSAGMFLTLAASAAFPVRWMVSQRRLFLGTAQGEWMCGSDTADTALTPTNFQARQFTAYGSTSLQPVAAGNSIYFPGRNGARMWELVFSADGYAGNDLSRYAEHLTSAGIVSVARQAVRMPGLWAVTADGTLLHLCADASEELLAWSRHSTLNGAFMAVAVIPSDDGDDGVFFLVERNGETLLEAFPQGWQAAREAGTPDVVIDAASGGSGLAVTSTLTLLPIDTQTETGSTNSRRKRAQEIVLNLLSSAGGTVVYDGASEDLPYPSADPFTGWLAVTLSPAHVTDLQVTFSHATSAPWVLLAAVLRWTPHEP